MFEGLAYKQLESGYQDPHSLLGMAASGAALAAILSSSDHAVPSGFTRLRTLNTWPENAGKSSPSSSRTRWHDLLVAFRLTLSSAAEYINWLSTRQRQ
eukprot:4454898-Pleurochrysis_carterae.AAC.2